VIATPWLRQRLQTRRDVNCVSEQVARSHHHVTDVDTNPKLDAAIGCETGVRFGQGGLRLHRALHRFYSASELGKDTITRRVRYAAPVFPNDPVDDCAPFSQAFERADLVSAHEAAVALHICCEDRNEASADCYRRVCHVYPSP
jgi:hypothetical protein